jgi:hypothetical protein
MRLGLTVVLALLALGAAGCGQAAPSERAQVARYLVQVNPVEKALSQPLSVVSKNGAAFARNQGKVVGPFGRFEAGSDETDLVGALADIRRIRGELAAIPAPPVAAHLRALLLELVDRQAILTWQTAELVSFLPAFQTAMKPLGPALVQLERALASRSPASSAAAVQAIYARKAYGMQLFQYRIRLILAALARISPPAVSQPSYAFQVRSLRQMAARAGRLASALLSGKVSGVPGLLAALERAIYLPHSLAAQRAQIAAVRAYDAKISELAQLAQQAEEARYRLSLSAG